MIITNGPAFGNTLYWPVRVMICPEPIEVINSPPINGRICRPEPVGLAPFTTCRNSGR